MSLAQLGDVVILDIELAEDLEEVEEAFAVRCRDRLDVEDLGLLGELHVSIPFFLGPRFTSRSTKYCIWMFYKRSYSFRFKEDCVRLHLPSLYLYMCVIRMCSAV